MFPRCSSCANAVYRLLRWRHLPSVHFALFLARRATYDVTFRRVVKNFLVQTGDKTGTGGGGESVYGGTWFFTGFFLQISPPV